MRALPCSLAVVAVLAPLVACATDPGDDAADPVFANDGKADGASSSGFHVCATQHTGSDADGDSVVLCDELFADLPRVKLPADRIHTGTHSSTIYAAIDVAGQLAAIDRDGTRYTLVDADGNAIDASKLPKTLRLPSHRALYTVYKLTGVITTYTGPYTKQDGPALQVTSGKPLIVIAGKAIDGAYLAPGFALEGTVSSRTDDSHFDSTKPVGIRISFTSLEPWADMPSWTSGTLKDGARFKIVGTIENWSAPVKASDGTCLPAFSVLADANTWAGATDPTVRLYRYPGMHFAADEVHVLDYPVGTTGLSANGMGGMTALHPAALIQEQASDEWSTLGIFPHSAPNGHTMTLHVVTGGGGACD